LLKHLNGLASGSQNIIIDPRPHGSQGPICEAFLAYAALNHDLVYLLEAWTLL
jgi:hypothetical protein